MQRNVESSAIFVLSIQLGYTQVSR